MYINNEMLLISYNEALRHFSRSIGADLARDLVHDLVLTLYERQEPMDDTDYTKWFIWKGVRVIIDKFREKRRRARHHLIIKRSGNDSYDPNNEKHRLDDLVLRNLFVHLVEHHLKGRQREVMEGVLMGKRNKQIAKHLGISESAVSTHLDRALHALRKVLGSNGHFL